MGQLWIWYLVPVSPTQTIWELLLDEVVELDEDFGVAELEADLEEGDEDEELLLEEVDEELADDEEVFAILLL